ncbi:cysteine-rich receptor-like protein kinase 26 isoform X2 [Cicer arietinum]|uniref:Cysteine-rich receptor-like protein kinase 26 isoform X2 n=1 Tax=Cicer arietinum TaxID=3827 RepID=A0A1S3E302_CICAR|nr:cysteine-rich receptor-like protein kinase 26 isoform X2 [Cicer arietinum]
MALFCSSSFLFCCVIFVIIVPQAKAGDPVTCDNNRGNYTANSTYDNNLSTLLSTFTNSHTQINYGFYNFSYGENEPDKAYVIGVCRGDVTSNDCRTNLNKSIAYIRGKCPNQKEAIVWGGDNTLWYSNRSIFGSMEVSPTQYIIYERDVNGNEYTEALGNLMRKLEQKAASGDSRRKYAADNMIGDNFTKVNGFVQCMPDLSMQQCTECLDQAINEIPIYCKGKMGGHVLKPSCRLRFDPYTFYSPTIELDLNATIPPAPSPSTNNTSSGHSKIRVVIATAVPVIVILVVLSFICINLRVRKAKQNFEDDDEDEITIDESLHFNFDTVRIATRDFSDSNTLGQGGFGVVYMGKLPNGQKIAVKRLSIDSAQGDVEFKNEVNLVAKLQHRNLVRLLGFSLEGRERLLIYEFVPNKSLDYFIFDPTRKTQLNWEKRYNIIKGIARGLLYLHEDSRLRIIHRDLKASNILLDDEMNPKISDFGLARLFVIDQTQGNTNRIVGTYGYMAPEYAMQGLFSAWRRWREGRGTNIIDESLINSSENEIMRCIHIALLCIQENIVDRPTMATIALMLSSYSLTLSIPSKPAYFTGSGSRSLSDTRSGAHNLRATRSTESINQASITDPYPR